ncbi:MAG TPA: cytochrome b562 [Opitutaceae bacterium]|nr:cytochrome b562 [Opitutaceae bacterium]
MNTRSALSLLVAFPVLSPALSAADTPAPATAAPAAAPAAHEDEKKTELEMRMDRIGKAFRKLKKQVGDPAQNASSLELVSTMEAAAKEAVDFTPAKAEDLPQDQRAKFLEDFRSGIKNLQDLLAKLQDALAAGKNADAEKMVADIGDFEKKEHKEFRRPEKD